MRGPDPLKPLVYRSIRELNRGVHSERIPNWEHFLMSRKTRSHLVTGDDKNCSVERRLPRTQNTCPHTHTCVYIHVYIYVYICIYARRGERGGEQSPRVRYIFLHFSSNIGNLLWKYLNIHTIFEMRDCWIRCKMSWNTWNRKFDWYRCHAVHKVDISVYGHTQHKPTLCIIYHLSNVYKG